MTSKQFVLVLVVVAWVATGWGPLWAEDPIVPALEIQSGPLMPGLTLSESPRLVHQVRLLVDVKPERGTLILNGNTPKFDEFGRHLGGVHTPYVPDTDDPKLAVEFPCKIELLKKGPEGWHLYRLSGPQMKTPLRIATQRGIADPGLSQLLILGPDGQIRAVVDCTRYGLLLP